MHSARARCLASVALFAALAACATPRLDVTPRYGTFDVEGDLGISTGSVTATSDLRTAGLDQDDSVLGARADFQWLGPHLSVSTQSSSHGGTGVLEAELSQGDVTIAAGAPVASELDLGIHSAAWTWDFIPTSTAELGLGVGATILDVEAQITDLGSGDTARTDELLPIPVLAGRAGVWIGDLELSALASGISIEIGGDEASFLDVDLAARYRLFGGSTHARGSIVAGYRFVDIGLDYSDGGDSVDADFGFDGPYVGLQISL